MNRGGREKKRYIIVATFVKNGERKHLCAPTTKENAERTAEKLRFCMRITAKQYKVYSYIRVKEFKPDKLYIVVGHKRDGTQAHLTYPQSFDKTKSAAKRWQHDIEIAIIPEYTVFEKIEVTKWDKK